MAFLNDIYITVTSEDIDRNVDLPSHPTETGIDLTDHVRPNAIQLDLSGTVVDSDSLTAASAVERIYQWQKTGALVSYSGRCRLWQMQIAKFTSTHSSTVANGADFSITLRQARIAKNSYVDPDTPTSAFLTQEPPAVEPDAAVTATAALLTGTESEVRVVFKGGDVYMTPYSLMPAFSRSRGTCVMTGGAYAAEHPYCLKSTDGGGIDGWVDADRVEGCPSNDTKAESDAGVKRLTDGEGAVYHTVRSGDNLWDLVNNHYKTLKTSAEWVIKNNPGAFSTPGDPRTLTVGARLLMGTRR